VLRIWLSCLIALVGSFAYAEVLDLPP
jgi:hypothetical protein